MFTGIIEELGKISKIMRRGNSAEVEISCGTTTADMHPGDSIAVNGVCLTVTRFGTGWFAADVSQETLSRTSLKRALPGTVVNLERAMAMGGRFGGHIVQGHVDSMGRLLKTAADGKFHVLTVELPGDLKAFVAEKGSIAIDGISLTVAEDLGYAITIAVIPHTYTHTNLHTLHPPDDVNIEVDIIARYTRKLLQCHTKDSRLAELLEEF